MYYKYMGGLFSKAEIQARETVSVCMAADAVYGFNVSPHVNFLSENLLPPARHPEEPFLRSLGLIAGKYDRTLRAPQVML